MLQDRILHQDQLLVSWEQREEVCRLLQIARAGGASHPQHTHLSIFESRLSKRDAFSLHHNTAHQHCLKIMQCPPVNYTFAMLHFMRAGA